jgi:hypothetical protein
MRVEALRVQLRPRTGWEAADLGFMMAREWWRPLWAAWLAAYLPLACALAFALRDHPFVAAALLWWLKPAFDRAALHVLSRAVFGETSTVKSALTSRDLLRPGLLRALTLGRFSLSRSFLLPVAQLEQLTGRAASARRAALARRERGFAGGLTLACMHFEAVLVLGAGLVVDLLTPAAGSVVPDVAAWFSAAGGDESWWSLTDTLAYIVAVCIVEPLYVAGGFALYLNRRTLLEGWDIEVALRRLAQRLDRGTRRALAAVALLLGGALVASPGDALAQDAPQAAPAPPAAAQAAIREVLRSPDFARYTDDMEWQYRGKRDAKPAARDRNPFGDLVDLIARIVQSLGWVVAALLVLAALWFAWRYAQRRSGAPVAEAYRAPDTLFGLAVAPESLPADVAAAALAAARAGRLREALSLLYRGALSALVHRHEVRLEPGDTEGDCVRLAGTALAPPAAGYFAALVGAWQHAAYAGREPELARVEALAVAWREHFAAPAPAAARVDIAAAVR